MSIIKNYLVNTLSSLRNKIKYFFSFIYKGTKFIKLFFIKTLKTIKIHFKNFIQTIQIVLFKKRESIEVIFGFILYATILLFGFLLYLLNVIDIFKTVLLFISLLLASIPLLVYLIKKREQTLLICLTSKYLMEKDESRLDDLLGVLIAGKLERMKLDPVDEFFKGIESFCESGDIEIRRRISEALPALYKINMTNSKEIVSVLRNDWDEKWKADNRRRTIESFSYLINVENNFILDNLRVIERDEFITIIAMLEILYSLEGSTHRKTIIKKIGDIQNNMLKSGFTQYHIDLLNDIWNRLKLIKENLELTIKEFLSISKNGYDLNLQVFAARNFRLLCNGYPNCFKKSHCLSASPERTIEFMNNFLSKEKHKYVRRPIANERSLECLVMLLKNRKHRNSIRKIIWKLISDNDDIIRITTFDKIDNILDVDKDYGLKIIKHLIENEVNTVLLNRAKRVLVRVS